MPSTLDASPSVARLVPVSWAATAAIPANMSPAHVTDAASATDPVTW
jgi:hypothetical protein